MERSSDERREREGERLKDYVFAKEKKKVTWRVRIGWRKTQVLRQLLTQCFLLDLSTLLFL